ncbi:predicted protein [Sclerotinia sclerotiorum 1980 UF-70]|uniref:Uncharacterized protein n=1 Tax=Sclerotinia sclerotiorum (strain ATCC 18683 / 1980 / Ss-1) TaxID=665079 RepID=A7EHY6_SCLS1|nr:predicted protein [Sclerotinia sclerotiorum 1980 UF-70]EDO02452.1 predicted protein [Sclerotinia sclerotiorum 1980 UF-70]
MQAPINDDCETVARFVKRFNRNKRTWESSVKGGRHDPLVLSITSRNIDKTGALKPPKNVHTEKYIRPSDRWIAANPSSSIGRRAESRDYIRAEDSIVKHVVSRLDTSSNMYFLVVAQYTSTKYTSIKYISVEYISAQYTSTEYTSIGRTSVEYTSAEYTSVEYISA